MKRYKMTKHDRRQARAMKIGWQPGEDFDWNSLIEDKSKKTDHGESSDKPDWPVDSNRW